MQRIENTIGKVAIIAIIACISFGNANESKAQSTEAKGKNWIIRLSGKSFLDDNVSQAPRNSSITPLSLRGKNSDTALEFTAQGIYKFHISDTMQFSADYELDHTTYMRLNQYDLQTHTFGGNATYKIKPTWRLDFRYMYLYSVLDDEAYMGMHFASPSMIFMLNPNIGFTRIDYTFQSKDNQQTNLRDTDSHSFGIAQYFFFSNFTRRITLSYVYKNDNALGSIYDLASNIFTVGIKMPLFGEINLNAQYRYKDVNYDTRATTTGDSALRDDQKNNYLLEVSKVLLKKVGFLDTLNGYLKFQHETTESTDKLFEYNKNVLSFSLNLPLPLWNVQLP